MKQPREYPSDKFAEYLIDCIENNKHQTEILAELWDNIQQLKQDLSAYQEVYQPEKAEEGR